MIIFDCIYRENAPGESPCRVICKNFICSWTGEPCSYNFDDDYRVCTVNYVANVGVCDCGQCTSKTTRDKFVGGMDSYRIDSIMYCSEFDPPKEIGDKWMYHDAPDWCPKQAQKDAEAIKTVMAIHKEDGE